MDSLECEFVKAHQAFTMCLSQRIQARYPIKHYVYGKLYVLYTINFYKLRM